MPDHAMIALNERSAEGVSDREDDELLRTLLQTAREINGAVIAHARPRLRLQFAWPEEIWRDWALPGGNHFRSVLQRMRAKERDLVQRCQRFFDDGVLFDDQGLIDFGDGEKIRSELLLHLGVVARGLRVARDTEGAALSFDVDGARQPRVPDGESGIANAWSPRPEGYREVLKRLGAKLIILPDYENPGHHDPNSPGFDPSKSKIPERHGRLLRAALPVDGTSTSSVWWACCEHRFFHRFQGSLMDGRPRVHWNATTNQNAKQNRDPDYASTTEEFVPLKLRGDLRPQLVVEGCGCREIQR